LTVNRGRFPSPTYIFPLPEGGGGSPLYSPLRKEDHLCILLRKRTGLPPLNFLPLPLGGEGLRRGWEKNPKNPF